MIRLKAASATATPAGGNGHAPKPPAGEKVRDAVTAANNGAEPLPETMESA